MTAAVTVGIPVYRGERFVAATLRSLQAQTFGEFAAVLSLDGPQRAAEEVCRPFLEDPRFQLVTQPRRLGWVDNASWLMGRAATPYFCLLPHDDLIDPRYLETLLAHAWRVPEAAVVYCDIQGFGRRSIAFAQHSVRGTPVARQLTLLRNHVYGTPWRGLTRVEALRAAGGMPANRVNGFMADVTWMSAVARWGELHRVPEPLYRKRFHDANEHESWNAWPVAKRKRAWAVHCAAMLDQALRVATTAADRRVLWRASLSRLVARQHALHFIPVHEYSPADRASLLELFLAELDARGVELPDLLGTSADALQRRAVRHIERIEGVLQAA